MKPTKNEFINGVGLADYFYEYIDTLENPFSEDAAVLPILKKIGRKFIYSLENFVGNQIYIKKQASPLDHIPPKFRGVVTQLAKEGIITNCYRPRPIPGWPDIPAFRLICGGLSPSGCSLNYEEATKKAIAECFERYSLTAYDNKKFIYGSWAELKSKEALNPRLFSGFSESQLQKENYAKHRLDNNSKFMWMEAKSIFDQKKYLIPTQLIYLGYQNEKKEQVIRQTTTNGAAAGSSYEMAVYNAICEAVERDSFVIHWLNKITPPQLDVFNSDSEDIRKLAELYKKYEIDFAVLDITTDLAVPAVMTVVREKTPGLPSVFVSPKTDLDVENAVFSSMIDGLRAGFWGLVSEEEIEKIRQKKSYPESIEERHIYWCDKSLLNEGDFLFAGEVKEIKKNKFSGAPLKLKLKKLKEIFKNKNLEVYLADATSKAAREAGLWVIMSLIPELCPLYLNEHYKCLGVKRLYEAPTRMGIFEMPKKDEDMNPIPHPML